MSGFLGRGFDRGPPRMAANGGEFRIAGAETIVPAKSDTEVAESPVMSEPVSGGL